MRSGYRAVAAMLPQVEDAEAKLWQEFESKKSAIDEVLADEGIYTEDLKQKCLAVYRYHQPDIHLYDGIVQMLIDLRKHGFAICLITDGRPEGQRAKIKALALERYVDHIIVTDAVSYTHLDVYKRQGLNLCLNFKST